MLNNLWVDKYRPSTLDGYVFQTISEEKKIKKWIKEKSFPPLLMTGSPGTGKTTLAKILINECGVDERDVMEINASQHTDIDFIRDTVTTFIRTIAFGTFKVVLLDEVDYLSQNSQAMLRGMVEQYSKSARFLLTANKKEKIIPALHSRFQILDIVALDKTEFTARMANILIAEKVTFDLETLDWYVKQTYPDLRACIKHCQDSVDNNILEQSVISSNDAIFKKAGEFFIDNKIKEGRKYLNDNVSSYNVDEMIKWSYNNLNLWGDTDEQADEAIIKIRNALVNLKDVSDVEIHVSALIIELAQVRNND